MGYHCVRPSILFYIHIPDILHFFESPKKLLKFKMILIILIGIDCSLKQITVPAAEAA